MLSVIRLANCSLLPTAARGSALADTAGQPVELVYGRCQSADPGRLPHRHRVSVQLVERIDGWMAIVLAFGVE